MKNQTQRAAVAGAIFAAFTMFLLSLAEALNVYTGAVDMMEEWHMYYNPGTFGGTISGMIEAALITYVSILLVVWVYDLLGEKKKR